MRRTALVLGLALGGLSFAPVAEAGPNVTLGANPTLGGGVFTTGGGISVALEARKINGAPHLCGVWARSKHLSGYVTHQVRDVLNSGVVLSGNDILLRDFRVFRQVPVAESYGGAEANCVPVPRQVSDLTIHIPNQNLSNDHGPGGPDDVRFKRSGLVNPAYSNGSIQQWIASQFDGSGAN
ncbi:hypothetical protein [Roseovarius sp. 2305UL8-3]|uniref:hypothetical protein n=1 Tax=Roseovarius conchicola TaxID=3121636 RepID=UPI0035273534